MKINRLLIPPFLRKFDAYLLARYPIVWETKIHFILFYSAFLGNLLLFSFAYLYSAESLSLIPYNELSNYVWTWGALLGALILLYYAYQQSFVRIPAYTIRQNILRFVLYSLAVSSIISNVLILPNTIAYRIRQLYDYQTLVNDYQKVQKAVFGLDLYVKYFDLVYSNFESDENERLKEKIKNTNWIYKNNQLENFDRFNVELDKIIDKRKIQDYDSKRHKLEKVLDEINRENTYEDMHQEDDYEEKPISRKAEDIFDERLSFLKPDYLRIKSAIQNQTHWNQRIRNQLIDKLNYRNILYLSFNDFSSCDFLTFNPHLEKILQKYLLDNIEFNGRKQFFDIYINSNLTDGLNMEMLDKLNFRFQNLLNYHSINPFILEIRKVKMNVLEYYFNDIAKKKGIDFSKFEILMGFLDTILDERKFEKNINSFLIEPNTLFPTMWSGALLVIFSISTLLLTAKLFTMRNLFISSFLILIAYFITIFLLNSDNQIIRGSRIVFLSIIDSFFNNSSLRSSDYQLVVFTWIIPFILMFISAILAAFLNFKLINFKWIPTMWVFLVSSGVLTGLIASALLLMQKDYIFNKELYYQSFMNILSQKIFIIYPLLILSMFLMYAFYNHLSLFPKRK